MKEVQRINKMFADLYAGDPWIGVNIMDSIKKISAGQANKKIGDHNSIWEILNHVIEWRSNVLQRIQGKVLISPDNNYFSPIDDDSEFAWQNTVDRLTTSQESWVKLLNKFREEDLENSYPVNGMSYYEHIHGILQHDAYHLGQINLLLKLVK